MAPVQRRRSSTTERDQREVLSLRALSRVYGIDRHFLTDLVRRGALPAVRRGQSLLVLREDFVSWFRDYAREQYEERQKR